MRLHPPIPMLIRKANEDYEIPNTKMKIDKGTQVIICNYAIHMDPRYFPDPEKFDPERFSRGNIESRHQFAYLPFGEGPRNCIGNRWAILNFLCSSRSYKYFQFRSCSIAFRARFTVQKLQANTQREDEGSTSVWAWFSWLGSWRRNLAEHWKNLSFSYEHMLQCNSINWRNTAGNYFYPVRTFVCLHDHAGHLSTRMCEIIFLHRKTAQNQQAVGEII